ncbi:MAG: ribonuclease E/G, partial [Hyphomicrobiaceae bacterium]|nr:ribonuclease E/G [Hyphomicrobiaceae bacterium]
MAETNKMLIDATHPEETRVVVLRGGRVEEFDYESAARKQLRGNIYLAKVTRVEPSLQAAFVDYGGNRHGFLAFNEIHPDYYQIPVADRQALIEEEAAAEAAEEAAAEARAEARARREAQRAAAKARRRAEQSAAGEARDDDDEDLDGSDDADEDGDDEVVDINAEGSGLPADASSEGLSDDEDHNEHEDRETTFGAAADETNDEASKPSTIAEASGLDDDERHSEPLQQAQADSQPAAGAPESPVVEAGDAAVAEEELDREAPVPHGLVEDQGVHEAAPETEAEPTNGDAEESVEQVGSEDAMEELPSRPRRRMRSYKIQEVIKRRQVVLVQVVKEERGNKGAALTTYLSLAGRYTVLMPNTARGGGISRKITQPQDRKRLKAIAAELDVPEGMGLIIRTAGASRTKQEIKRDFEYLLRLWESVRELTLQSTAPNLVYEEGNLIKRSIRDLYNKDVEEIIVAGDEAHREAKEFMRMLMPS